MGSCLLKLKIRPVFNIQWKSWINRIPVYLLVFGYATHTYFIYTRNLELVKPLA